MTTDSPREVARVCPNDACRVHVVTGETERERARCRECMRPTEKLRGLPAARNGNAMTEKP